MDKVKVLKTIEEICLDIFEVDNLKIDYNTSSVDIDQWDSLNHLNIISSVEQEFNIRFSFKEISSLKNVGDIVNVVLSKI